MKGRQWLRFFALLLAAALLGWLLPPAVFWIGDGMEEGKSTELQIRQIDLSFQSDLDTASRLSLARESAAEAMTPLERGIYLQRQDVQEICEQFVRDLTGERLSMQGQFDITPALLSFPEEGTSIAWIVNAYSDSGWMLEALIDDQTGVILRGSMESALPEWEALLDLPDSWVELNDAVSARLCDALCRHFNTRLDAALHASAQPEWDDEEMYSAELVLSEDGEELYRIPYSIRVDRGVIIIN